MWRGQGVGAPNAFPEWAWLGRPSPLIGGGWAWRGGWCRDPPGEAPTRWPPADLAHTHTHTHTFGFCEDGGFKWLLKGPYYIP